MHVLPPARSVDRSDFEVRPDFLPRVMSELQSRVRKEQFDVWFRGFRLVCLHDGEVEFAVPSGFVRDWLSRNYLTTIEQSVCAALGTDDCRVMLSKYPANEVGASAMDPVAEDGSRAESDRGAEPGTEPEQDKARASAPTRSPGSGPVLVPVPAPVVRGDDGPSDLNGNYTFENFVVGSCNRLSHAAALAIGDNPGRAYNPLFIHGNVGLGKTHLLQATCHAIRLKQERARVVYLSCEDFTNRFIQSIQDGDLGDFRRYYRGLDVLVVDDIQFLSNKEKTQEEFFHTFNALYNSNRQIIISSDRSPLDIPTIEERLVSRFKWGLVAEMEVPDFETRVAIVQRKARGRGFDIAEDISYFIAERIDTNIRELEGAVVRVIGVASITERELTVELAREALRDVALTRSNQITLADIMDLVTREFSISARDLTGKSRTQAVSLPRQICMYLCRQHTDQSLEEVGRFFGNRDHTTVLYAVQKIKKRVKEDRMFRDLLGSLTSRLQTSCR